MQTDKLLHFETCYLITTMVGMVTSLWWVGVIAAIIIAVGKEIYDSYHPQEHTAEWKDIAADMVGVVLGALLLLIF